jgi:hypothetical protein
MSKLADIYKQAHDSVLKSYQADPEDRWKVGAIARSRAGEKGHESTMFQLVKDVEAKVDELLKSMPIVDDDSVSPNKSAITVNATINPTSPP